MPDMEVEKVKYLVDVVKRRVSDSFMELFDLNRLGKLEKGLFVERVNRFTGLCRIGSNIYTCHIADTGRLKEILTEGREIILVKNRPELKTDYRLVSARMEDGWVLVNTSIHSRIGLEAIKKGYLDFILRE